MSFGTPFVDTSHQPIVIRNSKQKLLFMVMGALAFVIVGIWMVRSGSNLKTYYAGVAGLIFFGLCLLVFLALMFMPSLLLTIDDEGIHSHYPFWRPLTITWEEIASIRPIKMRSGSMFTVDVSPAGKQTYIARNFKAGNVPFTMRQANATAPAIGLLFSSATLSYAQAIAQIQEHYADQITRYQIIVYEE
jgi:hypothetical protein